MVAGGDNVDAGIEKLLAYFFSNTESVGRVFTVDDQKIGIVAVTQCGQMIHQGGAAGFANNIADINKLHGIRSHSSSKPDNARFGHHHI